MTKQLDGKVAIVTGSSNGIGRAIAEMFAAEGAKTVVAARRKEQLDEVVAGIAKKGGTALAVPTDVTQEDQVLALFAKAKEAYGRIDVVVNNAGVPTNTPTEDITLKYWNEVLAVNLTGVFLCAREAIRYMKAQTPQGGRIINMGSISAKTPRPDSIQYTSTKFAIQGMTHQITQDGRKYGVVSSIIHPGSTFSGFSAGRRSGPGPGPRPEDYTQSPDDVARIAVLMASLPDEVNLFEATILPNHQRSFISRG
jgi:NAD(P)-dependent dehydrogenase (short-subunit alcohol dehydrogenase family)